MLARQGEAKCFVRKKEGRYSEQNVVGACLHCVSCELAGGLIIVLNEAGLRAGRLSLGSGIVLRRCALSVMCKIFPFLLFLFT